MKLIFVSLVAVVVLTSCQVPINPAGKKLSDQDPGLALSQSTTLVGTVTYDRVPQKRVSASDFFLDYENTVKKPVRQVLVQLLDGATGKELARTYTSTSGTYSFTLTTLKSVKVRVKAQSAAPVTKVVDNTRSGALYALDSAVFTPVLGKNVKNLNAASGWSGSNASGSYTKPRAAAPFAILDTIYTVNHAFLKVRPDIDFETLTVNWSVKNNSADGSDLPAGDIGTSFWNGSALYILGKADLDTDEFDDHVIAHEWGHYFESTQSRSDSIGGGHGWGDRLDPRVAFGEGWGNALSAIGLNARYYMDTYGDGQQQPAVLMDLEGADPDEDAHPGYYSEASVQQILYDLWDSRDDGADTVSLGLGPLYDVMAGGEKNTRAFTTIYSFLTALKASPGTSDADIDALTLPKKITATDEWGTGLSIKVGSRSVPLYTAANSALDPVTLYFYGNTDDSYNKYDQNRFVRFKGTGGNVTLKVSSTEDVDFVVQYNGVTKATRATYSNPEVATIATVAGKYYVMAVQGFSNSSNYYSAKVEFQ